MRNEYLEKAKELRGSQERHYNCAQAVLIPFAQRAGVDEETCYAIAANFGGGMKMGSVCGAITGGLMALGLLGKDSPEALQTYYGRLKEAHEGMLDCRDLLRVNSVNKGNQKQHCDGMVYECVTLVEELIGEVERI